MSERVLLGERRTTCLIFLSNVLVGDGAAFQRRASRGCLSPLANLTSDVLVRSCRADFADEEDYGGTRALVRVRARVPLERARVFSLDGKVFRATVATYGNGAVAEKNGGVCGRMSPAEEKRSLTSS